MSGYSLPRPIVEGDYAAEFGSGEPSLDDYLRRRALANQVQGASRCFVTCRGGRVVGYYELASASVQHSDVAGKVRRNMPDPVPAILLSRLAVYRKEQGSGLGKNLLSEELHIARYRRPLWRHVEDGEICRGLDPREPGGYLRLSTEPGSAVNGTHTNDWALDVPGLSREAAGRLASLIEGSGGGGQVTLVDPELFLSIHLDKASVRALRHALSIALREPTNETDLITTESLLEDLDDWLQFAGD